MTRHPKRRPAPFTPVELRHLWTYSDGARAVKAYWHPDDSAGSGSWALVDPATGDVQGTVGAGEFSRQFRPVDVFADVTGFPTYLGTVNGPDGAALVDLLLDRNPFMLANGPRRAARPHALIVPRHHRDGWSSAPAAELAARRTAMTRVSDWYRSLDDGHAVFAANDSAPNLDYQRDLAAANGTTIGGDTGPAVTKNPRQDVQHAHLHAFYAEHDATENHESSAVALGFKAFSDAHGRDAVRVDGDSAGLAAGLRAAAEPWGGSYCSYQLGLDGPGWAMPALGRSQDEFNERLARADGLAAAPDPELGGAVNLLRPSLDDAERERAAQRATAWQRASFEAFVTERGLDPRSLA